MNWTAACYKLLPDRWRIANGVVLALFLGGLTWLYLLTETAEPAAHFVYLQNLQDLHEIDSAIDNQLLENRLELTRNYDALTDYTHAAIAAGKASLVPPTFLSEGDRKAVVKAAQDLLTTLTYKVELIDHFKRNSSVVRNSLTIFPVAASDFLDSNTGFPPDQHFALDRYVRVVQAFARAPGATGLAQIAEARAKVADLNLTVARRQEVDLLLHHGDVIAHRLTLLDKNMQSILNLGSNNLLEVLNREYALGHARTLAVADRYRMALYALAVLLLAYLTLTFYGLSRARRSLEVAHSELNRRYTAQLAAEKQLQLHAAAFKNAHDGITLTDAAGNILDVNPAFTRITGYGRSEVIGHSPRILNSGRHSREFYETMWQSIHETGSWRGEIWNRKKSGEIYPEMLSISAVHDEEDGRITNYVAVFADIGRIKDQEQRLMQMAYFDALTDLPNRTLLADRLVQAVAQTQRSNMTMAVCYLDLDGFKPVNDTWGHEAGDRVLIEIAGRMKDAVRGGDTVARLGGDEFVLLLLGLTGVEECDRAIRRLLQQVALPLTHLQQPFALSASIGVAFYPADASDPDTLIRHADQAMYQAKLAGKNRYHVFDAAQDSSIRAHHESLERIRSGLSNREFVLYYQPKVNMRSAEVIGAEALIRWQHPSRGLLAPAEFLPAIEDQPHAVELGEWVIDTALSQIGAWQSQGLNLPVSVNIGARQLQQNDFVERLKFILARHPDVNPALIELEILETSALADMGQVSQVIEDCARIGVRFALDDFGTGYSSLTYLKRLRVATLKIDQSFVRDMLDDKDDLAILEGVIGLARAFGREVIAEGVETVDHGAALLRLGCEEAQGFGIARPMPPEAMPAWAAQWKPDASWTEVQDKPPVASGR